MPWPNFDNLARRVLAGLHQERVMQFCIVGFAGLPSPEEPEFFTQAAVIRSFLLPEDPLLVSDDPLEFVAAHMSIADFAWLASALDRWHAQGVGDNPTMADLEVRCVALEGAAGDQWGVEDLRALRQLQGLLHQYELGALVPHNQ